MIRTATPAVNAFDGVAPDASQPANVATATTITIGTKIAETRSASRWTGAFPDCACSTSRAICASAVSEPTLRRTHDEPSVGVERRARDLALAPRPRPARTRPSASTGRPPIRPRRPTPSVATFSPGRTTKRSPTLQLADRHEHFFAAAQTRASFAPSSQQLPDRVARTALRTRLEVAAEQDERRERGRELEIGVPRRATCDEHDRRPEPRGERPDRDQRVHRRRQVARGSERRAVKAEAAPEHDRRRERKRDPLPAGELERRHHREQRDRNRRARPQPRGAAARLASAPSVAVLPPRASPRARRSPQTRPSPTRSSIETGRATTHGRLLGREVDRSPDAVELVQPLLDPRRA